MSSAPDAIPLAERAASRERALVVVAIIVLAVLAWAWTLSGAGMAAAPMAAMAPPSIALPSVALMVAMWWVMMAAMMVPSAAPMILLYGRVARHRRGGPAIGFTGVFFAGYLVAWLGASVLLTIAQLLATRAGLIDPTTMRSASRLLSGATLIAIGIYQFVPVKDACLVACRSPASFLARHWRPGVAGAVRLGLLHGLFCVGCCWLLMALLFVGGVMNFTWIAALTLLVAIEKLARRGPLVARIAGMILICWGGVDLAFARSPESLLTARQPIGQHSRSPAPG